MTTNIVVQLFYTLLPDPYFQMQHQLIPLRLLFNFRYESLITDLAGRQTLIHTYRNPLSPSFSCHVHPLLMAQPSFFRGYLHHLFSFNPNLNAASRQNLVLKIADAVRAQALRWPFSQVTAEVEIVQQVVVDQRQIVDGGYVFNDVGEATNGSGASRLDLEKLIESGRFYHEGSEEECAICFENYREGIEAIKMPCLHIFHENCIFQWLKKKNSCPLCRRPI